MGKHGMDFHTLTLYIQVDPVSVPTNNPTANSVHSSSLVTTTHHPSAVLNHSLTGMGQCARRRIPAVTRIL